MKRASVNLDTGRVSVVYDAGKSVEPVKFWNAVKNGGFTPVKVEIDDTVYNGPKS